MADNLMPRQSAKPKASDPDFTLTQLGNALRRLREGSGSEHTLTYVADATGYNRHSLRKLERGELKNPQRLIVEGLCRFYRASPATTAELMRMLVPGDRRGYWQPYGRGMSQKFRPFADAERDAAAIQSWECEYIPGLLQTDEYMRLVQAAELPIAPSTAEDVRLFRLQRQRLLDERTPYPRIQYVIGEAAIRYLDDHPDIQERQLQRLRAAASRPAVDVLIARGLHPTMGTSFTIMIPGPPAAGRPFVYLEALDGCRYVEARDIVSTFVEAFNRLCTMAVPIEEYQR
ncbi:helix-turn-helix domain-containing protein [Phytomonospora endophytica]|uniref:Transcriptional regulator with XRE-family HTH domain n=1 Tax=Phytomonospora endophytica TaxID=714109 RepID=A0A841FXY5_9ACTN|nr:helix-turn-helix transcriptional regulator [Phytomonospora endophytica]MBB6038578.1 transcriptional regulator with XRE-family HTH domain [Phytomonospora endophytica]